MSEAAPAPVQTATFDYWPQNRFWSFQLLRLLSESIGGGAEFTEVHLAARKMRVGQVDAFSAFHYHALNWLEDKLE